VKVPLAVDGVSYSMMATSTLKALRLPQQDDDLCSHK